VNRREFMKKSTAGTFVFASGASVPTHAAAGTSNSIRWFLKRKHYESLGPLDLLPQLDRQQQILNEHMIKYGTSESGKICMRQVCMPAETCAHYYAMTGDPMTLKAVKTAVTTFRNYRHKARGRRIPYEPVDPARRPKRPTTIEYETISCHVGRNMRGMRAAAHILQDESLLRQAVEEMNWWIDNPLAFNRTKHFFDARVFVDDNGRTVGSERKYTLNMGGSLASAMWMVGSDLGDRRLMQYAEDQIINGITPWQHETGYLPYCTTHAYEMVDGIALDSNHYHGLTLQVLSPLLAYKFWRRQPKFVEMMRRGAKYVRDNLTFETGVVKHPRHIAAIRKSRHKRCPKAPFGSTVNSALVHTRIYKYLGDEEALTQAGRNLRWLYWNTPSLIPFSHCFREVVLMAWEGIHLKQKGIRDVQAVLVEQR